MDDKNFKNMVLLGLMNIQWMLAQSINQNNNVRAKNASLHDEAMNRANRFLLNVEKYVDID